MNPRTVFRAALTCAAALLLSVQAQAQMFRSYLASDGNDGNACTLAAPCRLLPAALAAVADGGEIWMLDSANYNTGPVNLAKSVTILAVPGALGSLVAAGGNAVNIATAGVKVALRNLVIVPLPGGGGTGGIVMTAGAALTVENCLIANLPGDAIVVNTAASVRVTNTTIRDNGSVAVYLLNGARATVVRSTISGNNFGVAVMALAAGNATTADIAASTVDGGGIGVYALSGDPSASVKVSVHDSRLVRNGGQGVSGQSGAGGTVTLTVSRNLIANNNNGGIAALGAGTRVWASGNTVVDNMAAGLLNSGGVFESAGNNAVRNNGADVGPGITTIATK